LYLRPFTIASEAFLGVRPSDEARYCVIAGPAGAYFPGGEAGVALWLSTTHSRAGRGGTGAAKCGGNYAASLVAQEEARARGCDQVLFTDAATNEWVEEAGSMNIFFAFADGTLVTPPASGTILEGVTRASVIELAADLGHPVEERPVAVREWAEAAASGALSEVFATGTAAVVTPIARLVGADRVVTTPAPGFGPVASRLHRELTGIQYGALPDRFGWMRAVRPAEGSAGEEVAGPD
jgi:branched-chain amino acid aminotransferase